MLNPHYRGVHIINNWIIANGTSLIQEGLRQYFNQHVINKNDIIIIVVARQMCRTVGPWQRCVL